MPNEGGWLDGTEEVQWVDVHEFALPFGDDAYLSAGYATDMWVGGQHHICQINADGGNSLHGMALLLRVLVFLMHTRFVRAGPSHLMWPPVKSPQCHLAAFWRRAGIGREWAANSSSEADACPASAFVFITLAKLAESKNITFLYAP